MDHLHRTYGAHFGVMCMVLVVLIPFASALDTDGDGIEDHNDDCPVAEGNSTIDRTGCPDKDGDGTSDINDPWTMQNGGFLEDYVMQTSNDYYTSLFSKDGTQYITSDGDWVRIWETNSKINVNSIQIGDIYDIAWSSDGNYIAVIDDGDELFVYYTNNVTEVYTKNIDVGGNDQAKEVEFSPDSSMIAVVIGRDSGQQGTNGEVQIYHSSNGTTIATFNPSSADRFESVDWSPDGSRILIGGREDFWVYDTVNWQQNGTVNTNRGSINSIAWSPDGNSIGVCEAWEGSGARIRVYNFPVLYSRWVYSSSTSCNDIEFSPDSAQVAAAHTYYQSDGASIRIFKTNASSATIVDTLSAPRPGGCTSFGGGNNCGSIYGLDWHPNGMHIVGVVGRNDEGIYHWEVNPDIDGDGVLNVNDPFPEDNTQWNDTDSDGYGDNPAPATTPDSCVSTFGLSTEDRYGCPDSDGDGWSDPDGVWKVTDGADAFIDDVTQWRDSDGDGYGDNYYFETGAAPLELHINQSGDAFPADSTQWNDTDGDNWGDNYNNVSWVNMFRCTEGLGCAGIYKADAVNPDAFPLDRYQWADTDGDWLGDNADGQLPDGCPDAWGDSYNDRRGCPDSDGDGYSDPDANESAHPIGFADAFPDDPTQWHDSDGDGFGDNQSGNNPDDCVYETGTSWIDLVGCPDRDNDGYANRPTGADYFPDDATQWSDSDGDGYGDNQSGNNPDYFPADGSQWKDTDGDGCGDNKVLPNGDWWPSDPTQCRDSDGDGFGDNSSGTNGDQCPNEEGDADEDGIRGCPDSDGDGYVDEIDAFPDNSFQWVDADGDDVGDNDAVASGDDCLDEYGTSSEQNLEGCPDNDGDGWADSIDPFPNDPLQWKDSDGDLYGDNYYPVNITIEDPLISEAFLTLFDESGDAFPNDATQWADRDGDGHGDNPNGTQADAFPDRYTQYADGDGDGYGNNVTLGAFQPDDCRSDYGESWRDRYGCPDYDGDGQSDRNDACPYDADFWTGSKDQCVVTEANTVDDGTKGESGVAFDVNPVVALGGTIVILLTALVIMQVAKQSAKRKGKVLVSEDEYLDLRTDANIEEEARKKQWIDYYVSQGLLDKAKELGWQDTSELPQWKQYELQQAEQASMPTMLDLDNL